MDRFCPTLIFAVHNLGNQKQKRKEGRIALEVKSDRKHKYEQNNTTVCSSLVIDIVCTTTPPLVVNQVNTSDSKNQNFQIIESLKV